MRKSTSQTENHIHNLISLVVVMKYAAIVTATLISSASAFVPLTAPRTASFLPKSFSLSPHVGARPTSLQAQFNGLPDVSFLLSDAADAVTEVTKSDGNGE